MPQQRWLIVISLQIIAVILLSNRNNNGLIEAVRITRQSPRQAMLNGQFPGYEIPGDVRVQEKRARKIPPMDRELKWENPPRGPLDAGLFANIYQPDMTLSQAKSMPQFGPYNLAKGPGMLRNPELPAGYNFGRITSPGRTQIAKDAVERGAVEIKLKYDQRKEDVAEMKLDKASKTLMHIAHDIKYTNANPATRAQVAGMLEKMVQPEQQIEAARSALLQEVPATEAQFKKLRSLVQN